MGAIEIRCERADAVIRIQHRLFRFLKLVGQPRLQRLAVANQVIEPDGLFFESCRLPHRDNHLSVELADFAFQRQRTMIHMLAPADDVAANHFTGARDKLQIRVLLRQLPGAVGRIDDVSIANVFAEVTHAIIESNYTCDGQGAFNHDRRHRARPSIENQTIHAALADGLHHVERPLGLQTVLDYDVLQLPSQEIFNQSFVVRFDIHEVRKNTRRRPVQTANGIKELLHRFRAVRTLHRKLADRLNPMPDAFFLSLGCGRGLHGVLVAGLVVGAGFFGLFQPALQPAVTGLLARVFLARRAQLLFEG